MAKKIEIAYPTAPEMNYGWELPGDRIAILRCNEEEKTPGGIIIPDIAKEKPFKGWIAALGDEIGIDPETGSKKRNCPWFIGQLCMFGKYAGSEIIGEDGEEYLIMREHDILSYKPKTQ